MDKLHYMAQGNNNNLTAHPFEQVDYYAVTGKRMSSDIHQCERSIIHQTRKLQKGNLKVFSDYVVVFSSNYRYVGKETKLAWKLQESIKAMCVLE